MIFKVFIRNNTTGEIRECGPTDYDHTDQARYQWEEGNYSCDCNRRHFYLDNYGEENMDDRCSDGEFSARVLDPDGNEIYSDFNEVPYP